MWVFVALDAQSKLVPVYRIGKRNVWTAYSFMEDLASRLENRVQISSDSLSAYIRATGRAFGYTNVDYAQLIKYYGAEPAGAGRYSPPYVKRVEKRAMIGFPEVEHISTSFIERQNLTMRMCMRRFTRLTNAFSKKLENLKASVDLHFFNYNFIRVHKTLKTTPAIASGVSNHYWSVEDLIDA